MGERNFPWPISAMKINPCLIRSNPFTCQAKHWEPARATLWAGFWLHGAAAAEESLAHFIVMMRESERPRGKYTFYAGREASAYLTPNTFASLSSSYLTVWDESSENRTRRLIETPVAVRLIRNLRAPRGWRTKLISSCCKKPTEDENQPLHLKFRTRAAFPSHSLPSCFWRSCEEVCSCGIKVLTKTRIIAFLALKVCPSWI